MRGKVSLNRNINYAFKNIILGIQNIYGVARRHVFA